MSWSIASPVCLTEPNGVAAASHSSIFHDELMPYRQMPISEQPPSDQMSPAIDGLTPSIAMSANHRCMRTWPMPESLRMQSFTAWWLGGSQAPRHNVLTKSRNGPSRSGSVMGRADLTSQRAHAMLHSSRRASEKGCALIVRCAPSVASAPTSMASALR